MFFWIVVSLQGNVVKFTIARQQWKLGIVLRIFAIKTNNIFLIIENIFYTCYSFPFLLAAPFFYVVLVKYKVIDNFYHKAGKVCEVVTFTTCYIG